MDEKRETMPGDGSKGGGVAEKPRSRNEEMDDGIG